MSSSGIYHNYCRIFHYSLSPFTDTFTERDMRLLEQLFVMDTS